jgi:diguanylate cyclase (GGDEF)-like protein
VAKWPWVRPVGLSALSGIPVDRRWLSENGCGTEDRLPTEHELSAVLSEFARTMVTDFPIQAILDHLVERIVDIMPVTAAGVTIITPGVSPRYVAASDSSAMRFEELQTELSEGPCVLAYRTGDAVAVADLAHENRFPNFTPRALMSGLAAVFTFPLRHGDRQLGALDLYRETAGAMTAETMTAAQTLADVAAAYLLNAQARDDLRESSERAREAALHDSLTGLPNRVLMSERLKHALLRSRPGGKTTALFFVDLDRFKAVNDSHGHRVGDELLVAVSERLGAMLRPEDTLARLAGDEFVVLCEDLDSAAEAGAIGARLGTAFNRSFEVLGVEVRVAASIGIALADRDHDAPGELLHDADVAMYQAKRRGGARHQILDLTTKHLETHQAALELDLHGALEHGEISTVYQPIVAAVDGRVTGVEALLRWAHPSRGMLAPSVVIPLAEHSAIIAEIGRWVLGEAWADRHSWQSKLRSNDLTVSVNVSAHQILSPGFAEMVAATLTAVDADPGLLTVEMTESVFVRDSERALVVLRDLRAIGVKLAVDDFGTGYSSLSYLKRFPVDIVKIDRSLVSELTYDLASHLIVDAVVRLAHGLGMTVVAEGVETAAQHQEIRGLGCDACQGYYFARAMPAIDIEALIQPGIDGARPHLPIGIAPAA